MRRIYWFILISFFVFSLVFVSCIQKDEIDKARFTPEPTLMELSSVEDMDIRAGFKTFPTSTPEPTKVPYEGPVLNAYVGTVEGPSGKETYYNLPMEYVVYLMRELGYSEEEYSYWVRDDGCKMLGDYIMCAAALDIRPKGTILESSLGTCIVCDTGEFVNWNHTQIDIAVDW